MASYTFKKGDSLIKIAKKYGVSYDSLIAANRGIKSYIPGVTLRVPAAPVQQVSQPPALPAEKQFFAPKQAPPIQPIRPPDMRPTEPTRLPPPLPAPPRPPDSRFDVTRFAPRNVPPDMRPTEPTRQPPPQPGVGSGLIPGAFRVAQQVAPHLQGERIQGFADRLFDRFGTTPRQFGRDFTTSLFAPERTLEPGQPPRQPQGLGDIISTGLQSLPGAILAPRPTPSREDNPELRILDRVNEVRQQSLEAGDPSALPNGGWSMPVRLTIVNDEFGAEFSRRVFEDGTPETHARNVAFLWAQGQQPTIITEQDQILNGWSDLYLEERGLTKA